MATPKLKAPLGRRVTSYDVAVAAGVSQSTVSRCFRPDSEMAAATRARIRAVAAELGYIPNALARSLITRRSDMVALLVTEFTLRSNPAIVGGVGRALAQHGKQLLLLPVDIDTHAETRAAAEIAQRYPLDGLIVAALLGGDDVRPFLRRGVPVVFFNRPVSLPRVDRVATDHAAAAAEAAERLHRAGHREFVCLGGPAEWPVTNERARGFVDRLARLGCRQVPVIACGPDYASGRTAFLAHVRKAGRPGAVFCVNDPLAFGVLDACRFDLGAKVPEALSVVGFDDVAEAGHQSYDLTTIRQDIDGLASAAVDLLLRRLRSPGARARLVLRRGTLVLRGSARLECSVKPPPS